MNLNVIATLVGRTTSRSRTDRMNVVVLTPGKSIMDKTVCTGVSSVGF